MRFWLILLSFALLFSGRLLSQQDPMYSMYTLDKMLVNPGFAGSSNWAVGTLKYRNQFTGLNGHPTTKTLNFHTPVQKKHIGLGFKLISDKIAIVSNLNAALLLSYHLNFAGGKLSAGLEAGIINKRINYQELVLNKQGDNALPVTAMSTTLPDASYGFYYQKKQMYIGLSQYHLIGKRFDYNTPVSKAHLYSHFYILAGNVYDLAKKWSLEPSILIKYQKAARAQADLNATVYYNERVGLGLQYRVKESVVTFLKVNISENFKIAYAYDLTASKLSPYARGSHEIILSYGIKLPPPPSQKEIHPRYYF